MTHPDQTVRVPRHLLSEAAGLLDCEGYGPISSQLNALIAAAPSPEVEGEGEREALGTANANHEKFERLWYLAKDDVDRLKLAICGGEDVPGAIDAVSVEDCERFIAEERSRHLDDLASLQRPQTPPKENFHRWNIERDGDALLICDGEHEKSEGCAFERYVRDRPQTTASELDDTISRIQDLADGVETLGHSAAFGANVRTDSGLVDRLDPIWPNAVTAMLDRFDRAKGKGGYPTANEREAMRRCLEALAQARKGAA